MSIFHWACHGSGLLSNSRIHTTHGAIRVTEQTNRRCSSHRSLQPTPSKAIDRQFGYPTIHLQLRKKLRAGS